MTLSIVCSAVGLALIGLFVWMSSTGRTCNGGGQSRTATRALYGGIALVTVGAIGTIVSSFAA